MISTPRAIARVSASTIGPIAEKPSKANAKPINPAENCLLTFQNQL